MELSTWNSLLPKRKIRWMFGLKCGVRSVGGFFSHLMVLLFVNINCHMEMHGCVYRCAKPGVGLMLAHRHHPVSTGCVASATHRGVLVLMLGHHLRRWPNTESTVVRCVAFFRVEACLFHCLRARDNCADVDSRLSRRRWRGIGLGSAFAQGLVCADVFVVSSDFFFISVISLYIHHHHHVLHMCLYFMEKKS